MVDNYDLSFGPGTGHERMGDRTDRNPSASAVGRFSPELQQRYRAELSSLAANQVQMTRVFAQVSARLEEATRTLKTLARLAAPGVDIFAETCVPVPISQGPSRAHSAPSRRIHETILEILQEQGSPLTRQVIYARLCQRGFAGQIRGLAYQLRSLVQDGLIVRTAGNGYAVMTLTREVS